MKNSLVWGSLWLWLSVASPVAMWLCDVSSEDVVDYAVSCGAPVWLSVVHVEYIYCLVWTSPMAVVTCGVSCGVCG